MIYGRNWHVELELLPFFLVGIAALTYVHLRIGLYLRLGSNCTNFCLIQTLTILETTVTCSFDLLHQVYHILSSMQAGKIQLEVGAILNPKVQSQPNRKYRNV